MITYYLVNWYLTGTITHTRHLIAPPVIVPVMNYIVCLSVGIGLIATIVTFIWLVYEEEEFTSKENLLKILAISAFSFGFPIFIPLLIDICLTLIVVGIPVILVKSAVFISKFVSTSLDRKFEKYVKEASINDINIY